MSSQLEYYTFMGYDREVLRQRYQGYAERLRNFAPVLDVGCGRGELLELLREMDVEAEGVDADADMVAEVHQKGLRATQSGAIEFLTAHPGRFGAIFSSHLIEHLVADRVQKLVVAAAGALRPGGILVLVSPTPRNLQMHLGDFWIDLQHVRFYSPEVIRYLMHLGGLHDIEIGDNPDMRLEPGGLAGLAATSLPQPHLSSRWLGRLRERWTRRALPHSVILRLDDLEVRVNWLQEWVRSLYPPAEYVVTGVK